MSAFNQAVNSGVETIHVSDTTFDAIHIVRDLFHGDWNYSVEAVEKPRHHTCRV